MKKIFMMVLAVAAVMFLSRVSFAATSVDALIEKLVEKGTLTKAEGRELKAEVAGDEKLVQEDAFQRNLPEWVKTFKLKGDLRLRHQYEISESSAAARNRFRTRLRLGLENTPVEDLKIGVGLAGGATDPRSTNVTWENTFERPDLRLDYAFAEYKAAPWAKVIGGKFSFNDYLWMTTDMLWDTDINPYGASINFKKDLTKKIKGFANFGGWVIEETNTGKRTDPFLIYLQGGVGYKGETFDGKFAGTYYNFNGVKGYDLDNELNTNTQIANAADAGLKYDYDSFAVSAEVGAKKLLGGLPFGVDERIKVFGDFITNPEPGSLNTGWSSGVQFGNDKVGGLGTWQLKYLYVWLGKDAFPDTFPDSDRLGGRTDVKSHEAIATFGLMKNVNLGIDYYVSDRIKGTQNTEHLVQGDIAIKF